MCQQCGYPGDEHIVVGVAYPAERLDGHGEYMTADSVRKAAWGFLASGREIGFHHLDGTTGKATVIESSIHRGPDWTITAADGTTQVIKQGDWLLAVQFDPSVWPQIRTRKVTGFSIQGVAKRRKAGGNS